MPISGSEFEIGHKGSYPFLLELLHEAYPDALSQADLLRFTEERGRDIGEEQLKDILHSLIESDEIESKIIEDVVY